MDHDLPDFDLSRFLPYRLSVAGDRLSAGLARRYRAEFGISVAEWRVLVHVTDAGEVSIRDLERRVNLEKSKASRAATRLAQAGYIRKAPNPAAISAQSQRAVARLASDAGQSPALG